MAFTDTGRGWFDDWLRGDDTIGFIAKLTLADASVRYAQIFKSPGYRLLPSDADAPPRMAFTEPLSISILNDQFGQLDDATGRTSFEQFKSGQLQGGGFVLYNHDGELNSWVDDIWSDADGEFYIGPIGTAFTSFEVFFSFKIAGEPTWAMGGRGAHELRFRTKAADLNLNLPAQGTKFAGSGGLEGTANAEGLPKPRLFGRVKNMVPFFVDPSNERYLLSTAAIEDVEEAYEKGHPVGSTRFTKTLASGYFDLDNTATYEPVTCDAKGEKIDGGAYTTDAGKIVNYLLETLWGGTVDNTSVTNYSTDYTEGIGVYLDPRDNWTRGQALDWALSPLGVMFPEQDGSELYIQVVDKPESQTASLAFDDSHIASVYTEERTHPVWRVWLGYQEREAIPDPLPEASSDREYLERPRSYVKKEDSAVQTNYPNALELEVRTPIYLEADADTMASTVLALLKVRRTVFRVRLAQQAFHSWVGDYVSIQHPDYPQISSAKNVLVTGFRFDLASKEIEMECWG